MSTITLTTEGRRTYIVGNTYPLRDALRAMGAKWDATRKAWWTTKRDDAQAIIDGSAPGEPATPQETPNDCYSPVAGKAEYKGKTYYIAGRVPMCGDTVYAVTTRDKAKVLLYFRDGSSKFWAPADAVRTIKMYDGVQTLSGLRAYAARAKEQQDGGRGLLEDGYYYSRDGEVLASGCPACRRQGQMCARCARDYE